MPNELGLVAVTFKRHHSGCNPGETAGFTPAHAKELVELGYADYAEKPTAPEPEIPAPSGDRSGADLSVKKGRRG
jgi:hypothetical protein